MQQAITVHSTNEAIRCDVIHDNVLSNINVSNESKMQENAPNALN